MEAVLPLPHLQDASGCVPASDMARYRILEETNSQLASTYDLNITETTGIGPPGALRRIPTADLVAVGGTSQEDRIAAAIVVNSNSPLPD